MSPSRRTVELTLTPLTKQPLRLPLSKSAHSPHGFFSISQCSRDTQIFSLQDPPLRFSRTTMSAASPRPMVTLVRWSRFMWTLVGRTPCDRLTRVRKTCCSARDGVERGRKDDDALLVVVVLVVLVLELVLVLALLVLLPPLKNEQLVATGALIGALPLLGKWEGDAMQRVAIVTEVL
jgi:hypothetical protein